MDLSFILFSFNDTIVNCAVAFEKLTLFVRCRFQKAQIIIIITFPQPSDALVPGDALVGINSAGVSGSRTTSGAADLGLKPHLDHIGGLSKGYGHGPCGAASQQSSPDSYICHAQRKSVRT